MAKPKLLEVCPYEYEALVRPRHTQDKPAVLMLSRRSTPEEPGPWFVWVDGRNKTFANKTEAFAYVNAEYEGVANPPARGRHAL